VDFFFGNHEIPRQFTPIKLDDVELPVPFGLKMPPTDAKTAQGKHWEVEISRDIRIPMLVSVIKAAHLTLFHMLGYNYVLSAGGYFVGHQILGEFFLHNYDKPKADVLKAANPFFREYVHMVRPLISDTFNFQGTVTDNALLICVSSRP
jgi:hypothetical protein